MVSRTFTVATAVLFGAGCNAAANQPPARTPATAPAAAVPLLSRVDALLADAAVAATSGDPLSARQFLAAALALEPGNPTVRARLALLGGAPTPAEVEQPPAAPVLVAVLRGPVRRASAQTLASLGEVAPAAVAAADSARAAREDSVSMADSLLVAAADKAAPRRKHKRTWPWTRAQRWLVAKGVVGGSGAGVVVGAIIGNVPGALIAGSLGGGAVGFKKATQIGPAAPYPTKADSAAFRAAKERDEREKIEAAKQAKADSTPEEPVRRRSRRG